MNDTLLSLAATIVTALLGWMAQALQKHIKDARLARLLDTVSRLTEAAVANAYQGTVKDLKDPTRPGAFTPGAALAVKTRVIDQVKEAAPQVMRELQSLGVEALDQVLGRLVEKHVVTLNAMTAPPSAAPAKTEAKPAAVVLMEGAEP